MIIDMPEIISSGVHDRFPDLTWVAVETGSGWIPYILEQLDDRWWRNRSWLPVKLKHEPSFYFRRNWRSAFMIDHYAVQNRHVLGVDNLMWSTDYPHHGCDWPETRRVGRRDVPRRAGRRAPPDVRAERGEALQPDLIAALPASRQRPGLREAPGGRVRYACRLAALATSARPDRSPSGPSGAVHVHAPRGLRSGRSGGLVDAPGGWSRHATGMSDFTEGETTARRSPRGR